MKLLSSQTAPSPHLPHLVYLPGLDGTGSLFYRQAEVLRPFFNLHCLSLPPQSGANWSQLSAQAIALLKEQLGGATFSLCGESFGGCWALKLAQVWPQGVERLILVNPASSFHRNPLLGLGIPLTRWLPDFFQGFSTLLGLAFLAHLNRLERGDRRQLLAAMRSLPPEVVSWRLSLLQNFNLAEISLTQIPQPTLILASQGDRLLPSVTEAHYLRTHLPRAQVAILPHSGHACLLERELDLARILHSHNFLPSLCLANSQQMF